MANKKGRRRFGWVRKLPSGRYQASYLGPDGGRINGPETYERRGDAEQWLSTVESDMLRGEWTDPRLGRVAFVDYGERWIAERRLSGSDPGGVREHLAAPRRPVPGTPPARGHRYVDDP